jgi:ABC-type branched-subunit amino acid transport system substrate-binding protein
VLDRPVQAIKLADEIAIASSAVGCQSRISTMKRIRMGVVALALALSGALVHGARAADNVIKIGVVAAESGSFVSAGNTIPAAVKLAVKEINDAGGIKVGGKTYKFEAYYRDDRTNIDTAIAAARELVNDVGIKAI